METLKRVAPRHGLAALLHEKPFAGVNGTGKHNNWSMATDTGVNLLDPQDETHTNMQFLVFLVRGDPRGGPARRPAARLASPARPTTTASAPTRPRRRSSRSSSATCSPTSSTQVEQGLPKRTLKGGVIDLGARTLPQLPAPLRRPQPHLARSPSPATSSSSAPWARARASPGRTRCSTPSSPSRSTTWPRELEKARRRQARPPAKLAGRGRCALLKKLVKEHKRVIFDGDNYSEEWHDEAEKRGLPHLQDSVDVVPGAQGQEERRPVQEVRGAHQGRGRVADPHRRREVRQAAHHRGGDDGRRWRGP